MRAVSRLAATPVHVSGRSRDAGWKVWASLPLTLLAEAADEFLAAVDRGLAGDQSCSSFSEKKVMLCSVRQLIHNCCSHSKHSHGAMPIFLEW